MGEMLAIARLLPNLKWYPFLLLGGEKKIGLGVSLRETWKRCGFWQDSNPRPSGYEFGTLTITLLIPLR
jgi:hypothetical protein